MFMLDNFDIPEGIPGIAYFQPEMMYYISMADQFIAVDGGLDEVYNIIISISGKL